MKKIAVTGLGPLCPIGAGKEQFWNSVFEGKKGLKKITDFTAVQEYYGGKIDNNILNDYENAFKWRRAADISKFALIAMHFALHDSGIKEYRGVDTSLIVGITHGALNYTQSFHRTLVKKDVNNISPIQFSDSILNASAGNASIHFGIKGPVYTIVGGPTIAIKAVNLACMLLDSDTVDRSIIVAAEELNELSLLCYARFGTHTLSEGAGAILLEKTSDTNGLSPYCYISGVASYLNPFSRKDAFEDVRKQCLVKAGLEPEDIDFILVDSFIYEALEPSLDVLPIGSLINLSGNAFAVTTMWHIILSSLAIMHGIIPKSILNKVSKNIHDVRHIMICSIEQGGAASAIILSKD